jgi:predicted metal-dependent enzyme (double-stranded beta helix superfamily)
MSESSQIPPKFLALCSQWSDDMESIKGNEPRMAYMQQQLPGLLLQPSIFVEILKKIKKGHAYPDIRQAAMFETEIPLYLNRKRIFSIRMFLYGPGEFTPIHDHNSWGVSGTISQELEIIKYNREDVRSDPDLARLTESQRLRLVPGEIDVTLPLDHGIHQTGNPGRETIIMISVYGSPIRRLHVNGFDNHTHRIYKMYTPHMKKKRLAQQVLTHLE